MSKLLDKEMQLHNLTFIFENWEMHGVCDENEEENKKIKNDYPSKKVLTEVCVRTATPTNSAPLSHKPECKA